MHYPRDKAGVGEIAVLTSGEILDIRAEKLKYGFIITINPTAILLLDMLWWGFILKYLSYGSINGAMPLPPQWQRFWTFTLISRIFYLVPTRRTLYSLIILQKLHHNWDYVCNPFSLRLSEQPFLGGGRNKITVDVGEHLTPNHFKNSPLSLFACNSSLHTYCFDYYYYSIAHITRST